MRVYIIGFLRGLWAVVRWIFQVFVVGPIRVLLRFLDRQIRRLAPYLVAVAALFIIMMSDGLRGSFAEVLRHFLPILIAFALIWFVLRNWMRALFGGKRRR